MESSLPTRAARCEIRVRERERETRIARQSAKSFGACRSERKLRGLQTMGGFFSSPSPTGNESSSSDQSRILHFHSVSGWKEHFESAKDSVHLMVIDFTATWCGPCRSMEPVMIDLANRFSEVTFVKIDVDELKEVAKEWGVEAMPTFVMVKKGKEVDRIVGAMKDELLKKIEKHMVG